jgi:regulator of protease activity HflC (stomatin/prohibitin superfamily)
MITIGFLIGIALAVGLTLLFGVYTIGPTERGVLTTFGRAQRIKGTTADDPQLAALLAPDEMERYNYPMLRVTPPGGPYFKWPWQKLRRVSMQIETTDITWDPDIKQDTLAAVTKDNLNVSVTGQIRCKPCERNLYAYVFGITNPSAHVMGYFVSVLRDRIATFHSNDAPAVPALDGVASVSAPGVVEGISINDLRKNISSINHYMEEACRKTAARYGVELEAALITSIDPPKEVDEALASINTTQNQVAASISQASADADQKLMMAEQAVQIAKNRAEAEAAPIVELGTTLKALYDSGGKAALDTYVRNALLPLRAKASQTVINP